MWEPRRLTTLWAFMACYMDSFFTFFRPLLIIQFYSKFQVLDDYTGVRYHKDVKGTPWNKLDVEYLMILTLFLDFSYGKL
jgi:hypothetical protein